VKKDYSLIITNLNLVLFINSRDFT